MARFDMPGGGSSSGGGGGGFKILVRRLRNAVDDAPPDVAEIRDNLTSLIRHWLVDCNRVVQVAGTGHLDDPRHVEAVTIFWVFLKAFVTLTLSDLASHGLYQPPDEQSVGEYAEAIAERLMGLIRQASPLQLMAMSDLRTYVEAQVAELSAN